MAGALDGIRVLDLGRVIAGPFGPMLLADLGAEVIRVERSTGGFDRRPEDWQTFMQKYPGHLAPTGDTYNFINLARNKKAISLNFEGREERNTKARELLKELVSHCDVVSENFGPGAAEAMGITYDNFKTVKPDIIFAHVSGFGISGPYSHRLGFDPIAKAMSGIMSISGPPGPPMRDPIAYNDFGTALLSTVGVLAALYHRQRTGQGQMIDTSLLRTAVLYMSATISAWETGSILREQVGNRTYGVGPTDLFKTKDGKWVFVSTMTNALWRRFCRFIGREDLTTDPRFQEDWDRWVHRDILHPIVSEWIASQTAEEVFAVTETIPIPCGICYDQTEVAHDPHIKQQEMLTEVPCPDGSRVLVTSPPLGMSETPPKIERSFPAIGGHNEEIYCGLLGYSQEDLVKLEEEGII